MARNNAEDRICFAFYKNVRAVYPQYLEDLHHSPNGGYRTKAAGAKFKAHGTQAGFADYELALPVAPYHGLYVEVKTDKGRLSPEQKAFILRKRERGYAATVVYGAQELWHVFESYVLGDLAAIDIELNTLTKAERKKSYWGDLA